jgi:tRNA (cytidine/uridine-2'-O-)-methyltransferase
VKASKPILNIVLFEPEIPNNTGNIGRTCVGVGASLHLIEPLGFDVSDKQLKRSGLDYWPNLDWRIHATWAAFQKTLPQGARIFFIETGGDKTIYDQAFQPGDYLVFGKETTGIPAQIMNDAKPLTLPMPGPIRSFNLANTVAVVTFEAVRQFRVQGIF